jgi:hypothetical protein
VWERRGTLAVCGCPFIGAGGEARSWEGDSMVNGECTIEPSVFGLWRGGGVGVR